MDWKTLASIAALLGVCVTWAHLIFNSGRAQERIRVEQERMKADIVRIDAALVKLQQTIADELSAIRRLFVDGDNEPRLVSYASLREIRSECQQHLLAQISHTNKAVDEIKLESRALVSKFDELIQTNNQIIAELKKK